MITSLDESKAEASSCDEAVRTTARPALESAPELVKIRLDPAGFGRVVVGHQEVAGHEPTLDRDGFSAGRDGTSASARVLRR